MTSIFRLIFKDFRPPATIESAGVRPASEHVPVSDLPRVNAELDRLEELSRARPASSRPKLPAVV